jgi:hypothetical protein
MNKFHKDMAYEYDLLNEQTQQEFDQQFEADAEMQELLGALDNMENVMQENVPTLNIEFCDNVMSELEVESAPESQRLMKGMLALILIQIGIVVFLPSLDLSAMWSSTQGFFGSLDLVPSSTDMESSWSSFNEFLGESGSLIYSYWGACAATLVVALGCTYKLVNKEDNYHA